MAATSLLLALLCFSITFVLVDGQNCLPGWHAHAGNCYGFGESQVSWGDAQELCFAFKGKLAEIESAQENTFLKNLVRNKQVQFTWLGATDIFNEGVWEWVSTGNDILTFVDWAPQQPDDVHTGEDCLTFYKDVNYQWNDVPCDQVAYFLCEAPYWSEWMPPAPEAR